MERRSWSIRAEASVTNRGTWSQVGNPFPEISGSQASSHLGELVNTDCWGGGAPVSFWFGRSRVGPENVHFSKTALQVLLPWVVLGPFFANHGCLPRLFLRPLSCKPQQSRESPGYGAASLHPHLLLPTGHHHNACGTSHTLGRCCMNESTSIFSWYKGNKRLVKCDTYGTFFVRSI